MRLLRYFSHCAEILFKNISKKNKIVKSLLYSFFSSCIQRMTNDVQKSISSADVQDMDDIGNVQNKVVEDE